MKISVSERLDNTKKIVECTGNIMKDSRKRAAFFRNMGKNEREGCQILVEDGSLSDSELKDWIESAVTSLCDGAYRFSKAGLRCLHPEEIFAQRDLMADYGDGEFIFVLSSDGRETESSAKGRRDLADRAAADGYQQGMCKGYARSLGNLPNNYLHTEEMTAYAGKLAEDLGISCRILNNQELEQMGCGGLLAVNQGSRREAAMVVLEYEGAPGDDPVALVGKGLLFDSGGYHLKSIDGMKGMKYDMCGAAGVLETMEILVRKKARKNLITILLLAENVISADAVKMGDVITTLAGKTVEVYNTDAEGRLVLCDGITYAQKKGASLVIDLATLTYSAQAALGDAVTGLFCNEESVYGSWTDAAGKTGELFWRLPLDPYYHKLLEWSICADFANYAPGKGAGASVAACFLEKFVQEGTKWLHLDMVGPSVVRSETEEMAEGASGVCVDTLVKFLT